MVDMAARRKGYRTTEPGTGSLSFHLVWSSSDQSDLGAKAERCALSSLPAASLGVWGMQASLPQGRAGTRPSPHCHRLLNVPKAEARQAWVPEWAAEPPFPPG